jgi:hypothetical protein
MFQLGKSVPLWRRMDLSLRQFFVQLPLIAVPAKFIDCPLGNSLSFGLRQRLAQSLHDLAGSDQCVADAKLEEVATGHWAMKEQIGNKSK